MGARSAAEAVAHFTDAFQQALDCVTDAVVNVYGGYHVSRHPHRLVLTNSPVRLRGDAHLAIKVLHLYRIIEDPGHRGPYRVTSAGYYYTFEDDRHREVFAYHWHPREGGVQQPHFHLYEGAELGRLDLHKKHLPTGRIAIEDVLRFAIEELHIEPRRPDWQDVLQRTQSEFEATRSWPTSG